MRRISNCPPSFKLASYLKDPGSDEATTGDRIHAALETLNTDGLTADDLQTFEMCLDQKNELLNNWIGEEMDYQVFKEVRLGLTTLGLVRDVTPKTTWKLRFSGKADFVARQAAAGQHTPLWELARHLAGRKAAVPGPLRRRRLPMAG